MSTAENDDTFAEWLFQRLGAKAPFKSDAARQEWQDLHEDDHAYWRHEASAVRRAAARNGFRIDSPPATTTEEGSDA